VFIRRIKHSTINSAINRTMPLNSFNVVEPAIAQNCVSRISNTDFKSDGVRNEQQWSMIYRYISSIKINRTIIQLTSDTSSTRSVSAGCLSERRTLPQVRALNASHRLSASVNVLNSHHCGNIQPIFIYACAKVSKQTSIQSQLIWTEPLKKWSYNVSSWMTQNMRTSSSIDSISELRNRA